MRCTNMATLVGMCLLLAAQLADAAPAELTEEQAKAQKSCRHAVARLELARQTLTFVEAKGKRPQLAAKLAQLGATIEKAAQDPDTFPATLDEEIVALRRQIILSHPDLDFEQLLINKRPPPNYNHQSDQYLGRYSGVGAGLVVLDSWKDNPRETPLLADKLPPGSVLHPDLSFDGKRVLFSFCDHAAKPQERRYFIYEIGVDGRGLRQVTGGKNDPLAGVDGRETVLIEDWDPCYLPDGSFAFVSTRNQGGVRCHHGDRYCPTYTLYRANLDGSDIRVMSYGEANEWEPSVMNDGRVIWTRWDYINRHSSFYQGIWTIQPDGTMPQHFYGSYSLNPCSISEARAIPGSHKIVATATAHHSYTAGSIILIDPIKGQDGPAPIERVTPESVFPETEGWPAPIYAMPFPLNENLYLVARCRRTLSGQGGNNQGRAAYSIWLVDTLGGRELIYRDTEMSCFAPIPIRSRPTPPSLPSAVPPERTATTGEFHIQDVYESTAHIPRGSVKRLRVVQLLPQTTQNVPPRGEVIFETAKKVIGTAPVADDGSVAFRAPAEVPLLFQLLDKDGMSVMSMRSFTYLHPGERASCVGCHESRTSAPSQVSFAAARDVLELDPPAGPQYDGGLSFARTVQPVLDRHCIECHGLEKTAGEVNLLGTIRSEEPNEREVLASTAYNSLMSRPGLVAIAQRNVETPYSSPKDYFARAGRLALLLRDGDEHHAKLRGDDFQRLVDWLDLNAQFFGDYSWNKIEWRRADPTGEATLREHVRVALGSEWAELPYAALVNVAEPDESRVLMAPLSTEGGGWGQVEQGGWTTKNDAGYQRMLALVKASIAPRKTHDVNGTCNQEHCKCRSCWVRKAQQNRHPQDK